MAKLTRYTSFEALKADEQPTKAAPMRDDKQPSDMEAFVNLLKSKVAAKHKAEKSDGQ